MNLKRRLCDEIKDAKYHQEHVVKSQNKRKKFLSVSRKTTRLFERLVVH